MLKEHIFAKDIYTHQEAGQRLEIHSVLSKKCILDDYHSIRCCVNAVYLNDKTATFLSTRTACDKSHVPYPACTSFSNLTFIHESLRSFIIKLLGLDI